ncbi:hypothetical protein AgCh_000477 [Apium graveolens]
MCNANYLSIAEAAKLWHLRMGHLPFQQLQLVTPNKVNKECLESTTCQFLNEIFGPIPSSTSAQTNDQTPSFSSHSHAFVDQSFIEPTVSTQYVIESTVSTPVRQSTRIKSSLTYLQDYQCNYVFSDNSLAAAHWCNLISGSSLTDSHYSLLSAHSAKTEPSSYEEASQHPHLLAAMKK